MGVGGHLKSRCQSVVRRVVHTIDFERVWAREMPLPTISPDASAVIETTLLNAIICQTATLRATALAPHSLRHARGAGPRVWACAARGCRPADHTVPATLVGLAAGCYG